MTGQVFMADIFDAFEPIGKRRKLPLKPGRDNPAPFSLQKLAKDYTEEMLDIAVELARSAENESTRLEAVKLVLDRGWGKSAIKQEVTSRHINVHETLKVLASQVTQPPKLWVEEGGIVDAEVAEQ